MRVPSTLGTGDTHPKDRLRLYPATSYAWTNSRMHARSSGSQVLTVSSTALRAILLRLYGNARLKVAALRDEQEQDTADYALLLVLVALAAIAAMSLFASRINSVFTQISTILDAYIR